MLRKRKEDQEDTFEDVEIVLQLAIWRALVERIERELIPVLEHVRANVFLQQRVHRPPAREKNTQVRS